MYGEQSEMQNKIVGLAEELGRLKSELQGKGTALGLQGGGCANVHGRGDAST